MLVYNTTIVFEVTVVAVHQHFSAGEETGDDDDDKRCRSWELFNDWEGDGGLSNRGEFSADSSRVFGVRLWNHHHRKPFLLSSSWCSSIGGSLVGASCEDDSISSLSFVWLAIWRSIQQLQHTAHARSSDFPRVRWHSGSLVQPGTERVAGGILCLSRIVLRNRTTTSNIQIDMGKLNAKQMSSCDQNTRIVTAETSSVSSWSCCKRWTAYSSATVTRQNRNRKVHRRTNDVREESSFFWPLKFSGFASHKRSFRCKICASKTWGHKQAFQTSRWKIPCWKQEQIP